MRELKTMLRTTFRTSKKAYDFPFDYISPRFIYVELVDGTFVPPSEYRVEQQQVIFTKDLAEDTKINIRRITNATPLIDWQDASILKADTLNLEYRQLIHVLEELHDTQEINRQNISINKELSEDNKRKLEEQQAQITANIAKLEHHKERLDGLLSSLQGTQEELQQAKSFAVQLQANLGSLKERVVFLETDKGEQDGKLSELDSRLTVIEEHGIGTGSGGTTIVNPPYNDTEVREQIQRNTSNLLDIVGKVERNANHIQDVDNVVEEMGNIVSQNQQGVSALQNIVSQNQQDVSNLQNIVQNLSNTTLERNATYKVGDIVYHKDLPAGYYLECTVGGTTGDSMPPLKQFVDTQTPVVDGTAQFVVKKLDTVTVNMFNQFKEYVNNEFTKQLNSDFLSKILNRYGTNRDMRNYSNAQFNQMGIFTMYFSENNKLSYQPFQYGQLINLPCYNTMNESCQIFIEQSSGRIYSRGGNHETAIKDKKFVKVSTE